MQYHIQTEPIYEAFSSPCDCPLCKIENDVQERLLSQYLSDAVMEPTARVEVNKYGFCTKHLSLLFQNKNKLGLSLQLETRLGTIRETVRPITSYKQAAKQADALSSTMETCVICNAQDKTMTRYAYTIAQMYANEDDFVPLFKKSGGFCLPHYVLLLQESKKAGNKTSAYLSDLS
ncbi:MAG: hypothetical protein K2M95_01075, partial [Clostridiales bacterium]|nr:hypothetical protein [Clostridiales bacterium]